MPIVAAQDVGGSSSGGGGAGFGPCSAWPVRWCCPDGPADPLAAVAVQAASEILFALSGRQFGLCTEVTLRPCREDCADGAWYPWPGVTWPQPALVAGRWYNFACGLCAGGCSCSSLSEVLLPGPVFEVTQVKVDGSPLVSGGWRLDDGRRLVRLDGEPWPACNNLNLADTQVGTWSVTATYGQEVPTLGELAVGELACDILRGCNGEDCRLPANVTQLVRQGVTIQMPDPATFLKDGLLGLTMVDRFILATNPHRLPGRARVYSVDRPAHRRVGTG